MRSPPISSDDQRWHEAMVEYITTGASYDQLADKYGIRKSSLSRRGKVENWYEKRKLSRAMAADTVLSEAQEMETDRLRKLLHASDKLDIMLEGITQALEDRPDIILTDLRGIADIAKALKTAVEIKRNLYGLPTKQQAETMRINLEKLKIEKDKAQREKQADESDKDVHVVIEGGEGLDA